MSEETEWAPKQDMSLLCRVCANQHDYLIPIFQGEGLDHDMPTKMDKHLPIKVRENDKLPTQMCYQCASTIIAWSELHTNCLAADKKLKGMLKINEKKSGEVDNDDAASDHYEDSYDDGGGAGADDDEDFEQEIKQLISDAGVELGQKTTKATKRPSRAVATRKRKAEVTITPVKREPKKLKTEPKSSTALLKPKEEVVTNDDRFICHQCRGTRTSGCRCEILQDVMISPDGIKIDIFKSEDKVIRKKPGKVRALKESFECDSCNKKFSSANDLGDHKNIHTGEKPYICDICGKAFAFMKTLYGHQRTHMTEKSFKCDTCGKVFSAEWILNDHIRLHTGEKPFVCELCGKNFSDHSGLLIHKMLIHGEGDKRYKCDICSKAFFKKGMFSVHMQSHMDIRPFECSICQRRFKRRCQMKKHELEVHSGERPFKCNLCVAGYKRKHQLKAHYDSVHK